MDVLITVLVKDEVCGSLKDVYPVSQSAHHTQGIEYCVETLSDAYQMLCPGFHVSDRRAERHHNTAFRRKHLGLLGGLAGTESSDAKSTIAGPLPQCPPDNGSLL